MARTKISEFSATAADNTDIDSIDIAEGCAPSGINNAIRELMAQLKDMQTGASGDTFTLTTVNSTTVDTTNLEVTNLKAKDGTAAGSIANSTGIVTLASSVLTTTDINGGTIDGTSVGASTRGSGAFTTLASNGATTFTANTASTSTTTGTAVITGGLGVSGRINAANFDGIVGANTAAAGKFTTLGATGVATFSAGTVSAPAITTSGDTNTGIFFPAADTIAFAEGGAEAMRINSSGNVGIGTSSPVEKLDVVGNAKITSGSSFYWGDATCQLSATNGGALRFLVGDGGEKMRIDSSGNVGIGTSSQILFVDRELNVNAASGSSGFSLATGGTARLYMTGNSSNVNITTKGAIPLLFGTNEAERMRIDSSA
jgi:hypothetical protein